MGMPSTAIYATELMRFYGVTTLVRVGSCGALQDRVALRDVVVATAAHTDSAMNRRQLQGIDFAPPPTSTWWKPPSGWPAGATCPRTWARSCRRTRSTTATPR